MRRRQSRNERERQRIERIDESGRKHTGQSGRILLRFLQELFNIRIDFQLVVLVRIRSFLVTGLSIASSSAVTSPVMMIGGRGGRGRFGLVLLLL